MKSLDFDDQVILAGFTPFGPAALARRQATGAAAVALALAALTLVALLRADQDRPAAPLSASVSITAASMPVTAAFPTAN